MASIMGCCWHHLNRSSRPTLVLIRILDQIIRLFRGVSVMRREVREKKKSEEG